MNNRVVNFDDAKNTLEIIISGKTFTIKKIVSGVSDQYNLYIQKTLAFKNRMEMVLDKLSRGEMIEDLSAEKISDEMIEWKATQLEKILSMILKSNGEDFDDEWWADNASYEDIINFIHECITKDNKKKELAKEI